MLRLTAISLLFALVLAACTQGDPIPTSTPDQREFVVITSSDDDESGTCETDENGVSACDATPAPIAENVLVAASPDVVVADFSLPSASGDLVQLSNYLGKQPFVIVFYRGFF